MINRLEAVLLFYKPYFLWSLAVNVLIVIFNPYILPSIITKLILTFFVWYLVHETNAKRKLIFYKNLGISTGRLFASLFLIDVTITIIFVLVISAFI